MKKRHCGPALQGTAMTFLLYSDGKNLLTIPQSRKTIYSEVTVMKTEEFAEELKRVQQALGMTEEQIQTAIEMHKKLQCGEVSTEELKEKLGV